MKQILLLFSFLLNQVVYAQNDLTWLLEYNEYKFFNDKFYWVRNDEGWGLTDNKGNQIIEGKYKDGVFDTPYNLFVLKNEIDQYGIIDIQGHEIMPFKYEDLIVLDNKTIIAKLGNKYGCFNGKGENIIPIKYDNNFRFNDGKAVVKLDGREYIINQKDEVLASSLYSFNNSYKDIFIIEKNHKYGLVNSKGKKITPIQYSLFFNWSNNGTIPYLKDGFAGILNEKGEEIIEPKKYKFIYPFHKGLASVQANNGKWGYINEQGTEIVSCQFETSQEFDKDNVVFAQKSRTEYILLDNSGKEVIDSTFSGLGFRLTNNLKRVRKTYGNNYQGLFDISKKKWIIQGSFENIVLYNSIIYLTERKKLLLIDTLGNTIQKFEAFDGAKSSSYPAINDLTIAQDEAFPIAVLKNGKWGFIDKYGKVVIDFQYDKAEGFNLMKFAQVCKGSECGFIDKQNNIIMPFKFDYIQDNKIKKYFLISKNGKYGISDYKGNIITQIMYDKIEIIIHNHLFRVYQNGKCGLINQFNKELLPIIYDNIILYPKWEIAIVVQNDKMGLVTLENQVILPMIYENIGEYQRLYEINDNLKFKKSIIVTKGGKKGVVNKNNNIIVPFEYEKILYHKFGFIIAQRNYSSFDIYQNNGQILDKEFTLIKAKYDNNFLILSKDDLEGVLFENGKLLPCKYSIKIWGEQSDVILVKDSNTNQTALFDIKGEALRDFEPAEYSVISPTLAIYSLNGKSSLMNSSGKLICKPIYGRIVNNPFFGQKNEALVIEGVLEEKTTNPSKSIVKYGLLGINGKEFLSLEYDNIIKIWNKVDCSLNYFCTKNKKYGVINSNGKITIPFEYEELIEKAEYGFIIAKKNGLFGVIDFQNNIIQPITQKAYWDVENFISEY